MGLSSAVDWWEVWQLRILVLGSQFVQLLLFFSATRRKSNVSASVRLLIWLAYLGSDALAIYALAALFNRHRKQGNSSLAHEESILEVVWAPVLLLHLGGQDCITAYNMEDNELWRRHVLTAISQAAIMLFTIGGIRCFEKPYALKKASISSLVSSCDTSARTDNNGSREINSLGEYVANVSALFRDEHHHPGQAQGEGDVEANHLPDQAQGEGAATDDETGNLHKEQGKDQVNKLFVDLASPYHHRLVVTESFLKLDEEKAYMQLQDRLSDTFDLLYTKGHAFDGIDPTLQYWSRILGVFVTYIRIACSVLPFAAIGLFHKSHREAYNDYDVKVTYTLLCCTAAMGFVSIQGFHVLTELSSIVSQYSFVGFFAQNEKYTTSMFILSCLRCKDYVDQHWCMKPRKSSSRVTILVLGHVERWWKQHIRDSADYMRFNNHRGQWTIQQAGCGKGLGWSMKRPFDESVLLWHIATDLCFYKRDASAHHACGATAQYDEEISASAECPAWCTQSAHHVSATGCREISNYMMYLMFAKPEMLMAGTRRKLFIAAYNKLNKILKGQEKQPPEQQPLEERSVALRVFARMEKSSEKEKGFVHDAWVLAKAWLALDSEKKMWDVIEGVWVEMLCFSASRCRGYLHAKSLGTGAELLTFVWLLWSHMGMETLAEKMQMPDVDLELPGEEENNGSVVDLIGPMIETGSSLLDIVEEIK